jgi:hypothetical protein
MRVCMYSQPATTQVSYQCSGGRPRQELLQERSVLFTSPEQDLDRLVQTEPQGRVRRLTKPSGIHAFPKTEHSLFGNQLFRRSHHPELAILGGNLNARLYKQHGRAANNQTHEHGAATGTYGTRRAGRWQDQDTRTTDRHFAGRRRDWQCRGNVFVQTGAPPARDVKIDVPSPRQLGG